MPRKLKIGQEDFIESCVELTFNDQPLSSLNAFVAVGRAMVRKGEIVEGAELNFNSQISRWVREDNPQAYAALTGGRATSTFTESVEWNSGSKFVDYLEALLDRKPWGDKTPRRIEDFWKKRVDDKMVDKKRKETAWMVVPLRRIGEPSFFTISIVPVIDQMKVANVGVWETLSAAFHHDDRSTAEIAGRNTGKRVHDELLGFKLSLTASGITTSQFGFQLFFAHPSPRRATPAFNTSDLKKKLDTVWNRHQPRIVDSKGRPIKFNGEQDLVTWIHKHYVKLARWQIECNKLLEKDVRAVLPEAPEFTIFVPNGRTSCLTFPQFFSLLGQEKKAVQAQYKDQAYFGNIFYCIVDDRVSVCVGVPANGELEAQDASNPTPNDQVLQVFATTGLVLPEIADADGLVTDAQLTLAGIEDASEREKVVNLCGFLRSKTAMEIKRYIMGTSAQVGTGVGAFGRTYRG